MKIRPNSDKPPALTGQHAQVLKVLQEAREPLLSLSLQRQFPQIGARVHELRVMGFNIMSIKQKPIVFDGVRRIGCVAYALATPNWCGKQGEKNGTL